jgi:hypothetical protein
VVREEVRIFIGFDPREAVAYHTCVQSIIEHARDPNRLSFTPIRGERRDGSNDFIYARFLVPYLTGYKGKAVFLDGDMIVRAPIEDLVDLCPWNKGVAVVKHDYKTKYPIKYLGNKNGDYPRKNWSSVVVWNCGFYPNRVLTPEFVDKASGEYLHRFHWLSDEHIHALPKEWNRLALEEELTPEDKLRHYTIGTPCFEDYKDTDPEWWGHYRNAIAPCR